MRRPPTSSNTLAAPEDVTCAEERCLPAGHGFKRAAHGHGADLLEAAHGVGLGVQRQRGRVFGETVAVGEVGVGFLNVAAVGQQNGGQIACGFGGPDLAMKAFFGQQGQVTGVVQMGVGQQHGADVIGQHRQWLTVAQAQLFVALEQPAVHHQALSFVFDEVFGAGHGACCA